MADECWKLVKAGWRGNLVLTQEEKLKLLLMSYHENRGNVEIFITTASYISSQPSAEGIPEGRGF
jgi:hypothetical protein